MAWIMATPCTAFSDRRVIGVLCGGQRLAIYKLPDGYFATRDACPHQGSALSEGCVVESYIECPSHHALFDIRTGAADGSVTSIPLKTYPTRVENDHIYVDLDDTSGDNPFGPHR